ncbi:MAG: BMP family ABC transporter substrate-binding protein [Myxococcaceae bacterium]|nr:BMP family ABC transporter substrate-binding protein [Myxococcaceae bacterium]
MLRTVAACALLLLIGCKKSEPAVPGATPAAAAARIVGVVTDVGGRGDQSFNDSALRGLEAWAAAQQYQSGSYAPLSPEARTATIPEALRAKVTPLSVKPLVLQSKSPEDYQPNLQLLVDQRADLTVGVGFLLENAVEQVAKANPKSSFLLIDSPILDAQGQPAALPNVRTVVFREEEGSFLAGVLAGFAAKDTVGFVGGMEIPLIKKFEAGFRAGVKTANPKVKVLVGYTGSFDNVAAGKQLAQDQLAKGAEVVFQAAGSDGLGAIQAVKEAKAAGKRVFAIGVDSDQAHLAPDAMLTSMVKRVDLAVYEAAKDLSEGKFTGGDRVMGLKEGGVSLAPVTLDFEGKAAALARVDALQALVAQGKVQVPANLKALETFEPPAP